MDINGLREVKGKWKGSEREVKEKWQGSDRDVTGKWQGSDREVTKKWQGSEKEVTKKMKGTIQTIGHPFDPTSIVYRGIDWVSIGYRLKQDWRKVESNEINDPLLTLYEPKFDRSKSATEGRRTRAGGTSGWIFMQQSDDIGQHGGEKGWKVELSMKVVGNEKRVL